MITSHGKGGLVLHDGERDHTIRHAAFAPAKPHAKGGMHPAITEDWHTWLQPHDVWRDFSDCPVAPVLLTITHPLNGGKEERVFIPIVAWLQATYGPDNLIVSVPIDGDANAQRLHWLHRDDAGKEEMKAVLKWMNAWRLREDGTVPDENEYVATGMIDHRAVMQAAMAEEDV